jgi:hypothetical protein
MSQYLIRRFHSLFEKTVNEHGIMCGFIYTIDGGDVQIPEKIDSGHNSAWTDMDSFTIYCDDAMELAQDVMKRCANDEVVRLLDEEHAIMNGFIYTADGGDIRLPEDIDGRNRSSWINNWLMQDLCILFCSDAMIEWAQHAVTQYANNEGVQHLGQHNAPLTHTMSRVYQRVKRVLQTLLIVATVDYSGTIEIDVTLKDEETFNATLAEEISESENKIMYLGWIKQIARVN